MFENDFVPFYRAYGDSAVFEGEILQEKESDLLRSWYPDTAGRIRDMVEEELNVFDYEGSRIYDEYPDRRMLKLMSDSIGKKIDEVLSAQSVSSGFPRELAEVLFYHGIYRRRCRRKRCRGY